MRVGPPRALAGSLGHYQTVWWPSRTLSWHDSYVEHQDRAGEEITIAENPARAQEGPGKSGLVLSVDRVGIKIRGVAVLEDASLTLRDGEFLGLCSEHEGAKDTFLDILSGVRPAATFRGDIILDGRECRFSGPRDAHQRGIVVVRKELTLVQELSVANNLMLEREPKRFGLIDEARLEAEACEILENFGLASEIRANQSVAELDYGLRQMLEITRGLARGARVLVLDEPTSPLSPRESERLVSFLRAQRGTCACIYFSRNMRQLFELCDRITVLRDGRTVETAQGTPGAQRTVRGRYAVYDKIGSGGMASVHLGKVLGSFGFSSTVAIKRLYPQMANDPQFVAMFFDEARLASRVQHPNVVRTLDVFAEAGELCLVMEYVEGESTSRLFRMARDSQKPIPVPIVVAVITGVLHGLHAAHQATNEHGELLRLVHRDISPHNIIVGTDGVARVIDFGVAKAAGRSTVSTSGQLKGKIAYMAPEQVKGRGVTHLTDVYGASVCLWELLTGERLFEGENQGDILGRVLDEVIPPPTELRPDLPPELDAITLRGLRRNPEKRFASARQMAMALENAVHPATASEVGDWVIALAGVPLGERREKLRQMEREEAAAAQPSPKG
jgi:ABC-type branched-subunit amino acid transport system ATPase component